MYVVGTSGNDSLVGTSGDDTLEGLGGADTLVGQGGNDTYIVTAGDVISDSGGIDTVLSSVSWTAGQTTGVDHITLTGTGAIGAQGNNLDNRLVGNDAANVINGRAGNDTLIGNGGNDVFDISAGGTTSYGNDSIDGGSGTDAIDFLGSNALSAVVVDLGAGTASGGGSTFILVSIETAVGGAFGDTLRGSSVANGLYGGAGNDSLNGLGGNDTLSGGAGSDNFDFTTAAGAGNVDVVTDFASGADKLRFDAGVFSTIGAPGNFAVGDGRFWAAAGATQGHDANDRIIFNTTTRSLYYDADGNGASAAQLIASFQGTSPIAATDIAVIGGGPSTTPTNGDDSLTGTSGNDTIDGLGGNDTLAGMGGNDVLRGGTGNDVFRMGDTSAPGTDRFEGGDGIDTIDYSDATSAVMADLTETGIVGGGVGGAGSASQSGVEIFIGGAFNDRIVGSEVANRLEGGAGNDSLNGEAGFDTLVGGSGADVFELQAPGSADLVADFASGADRIQVHGNLLRTIGRSGDFAAGDGRFHAAAGATAGHDADDRLIYDTSTGNLYYDADGNGTQGAQLLATLQGAPSLAATDITVVQGQDTGTPDSRGIVTSFADSSSPEINALLTQTNEKWGLGGAGTGASLTFSFRNEDSRYNSAYGPSSEPYHGFTPLTDSMRDSIRSALDMIAEVANLEFTELVDSATVAGDLRFGNSSLVDGQASAWAYYPANSVFAGDIWFSNGLWGGDDDPGSFAFHTVMHEIGHGLGLKHPHDGSPNLDPARDSNDYTVMSYVPSPGSFSYEHTPMLLDVAALQYIYGANMETRAGNDVYSWGIDEPIHETLWDAGGVDTLDWSNQSQGATINLNAGAWSDIGPSRGETDRNFMIAYGAIIENVLGGAGTDTLIGNAIANALSGGLGNDILAGGAGNDTLTGGAGNDGFFFEQPAGGADQVVDFASGSDRIRLDSATFTGLGGPGNFAAGDVRFHAAPGANAAHDADDRIIYNTTTGQLRYDADGNGAAAPVLIAVLQPGAALAATDIQVDGPDGSQVINGTSGNDSLVGGAGNDTLNGLGGNDTLEGMDGNDSLSGGVGNDVLDGGEGGDTLDGGAGDDTYLNPEFFDDVIVDAAGIDTAIIDQEGYSLPDGIENLTVRGVEEDFDWNVAGNALDNVITIGDGRRFTWVNGRDGDDTLIGGAGSERFELYNTASGDYGNDVIDAGGGDFDVIFFPGDSAIVLDMRTGTAAGGGTGGSGSLVFTGIDYVLTSGHFHDRMTADDSGVTLKGGGGDDTLIGGAGDDFLDGEGVWEMWSSETGDDSIFGGAGNDTIDGWNGDNFLVGGTGDDLFMMNGMEGEYGHNTIDGGDGQDTLSVQGFDVVVDLVAGTLTGGNDDGSGSASLASIEHLSGFGEFHGNAAANRLEGGGIFDGREGNDVLSSVFGSNYTAVFSVAPGTANADLLVGFDTFQDRIHLQTGVHSGLGAVGQFAAGDERFWAAAGANTGHDANDRVVYNTSTGQLWYDADGNGAGAAQLIATLQGAPSLAASDVWAVPDSSGGGVNLVGTPGNDSLTGTGLNDTIDGLGGHDTIHGVAGSDLLIGGAGNDSLVGGQDQVDPWSDDGHDTLLGGDGNDTLDGAANAGGSTPRNIDTLDGGAGDDLFLVDRPEDVVLDSGGVDTVSARDTDFTLGEGIENLELLVGFSEGSTGIGNELANRIGGTWRVSIEGRGGNDTILGSGGNDNLFGDDGDDFINGEDGRDRVEGGAGNDTLDGGAGAAADTLTGGAGADLFLATWSQAIITDFASGSDRIQFDGERFLNPGPSGAFSAGDQRFHSGAGVTAAHDASDRVIYNSSTGDLYYDEDGTGATEALLVATLQGAPAISATDLVVVNGTTGGTPPIQGTAGNDSLVGTAGNDTFDGLAGNDTMDGLGGDDVFMMSGTYGADRAYGRDGIDTVNFGGATGAVNASIVGSFASGGGGSAGMFTIENLVGSAFNDGLIGDANANRLEGGAGNDTLTGREGDDVLLGNDGDDVFIFNNGGSNYGNDAIDGGAGIDRAEFGSLGRTAAVIDLAAGTVSGGGTGGLGSATLAGIENVIGTSYADRITGNGAANDLAGSTGNDTLAGGAGADTLSGGAGNDFFDFTAAPAAGNADRILDFVSGTDDLRFDDAVHAAIGATGAFAAADARFWAAAGATSGHDANDRLVYDTSTGSLYYDADGSGGGASVLVATFQGNPALAAADIAVI